MNYIKIVTQTCQNETQWNIKRETESLYIMSLIIKEGQIPSVDISWNLGIYFILTLGLFNNNLGWKGKKLEYSLESRAVKDLQISGNLLFALLDLEFCFLLLGDPNVDFDLFIPEGCGFPIIPYFLIFMDSDNFEFCTFFSPYRSALPYFLIFLDSDDFEFDSFSSPSKSAFVLALIMFLGTAGVGLGDTSLLFEQFVAHLGNA